MRRTIFLFNLLVFCFLCLPIYAKEITLKEALQIAIEKNYNLKKSEEDLKEAIANLRVKSNLATISMTPKLSTGSNTGGAPFTYREIVFDMLQNAQTGDKLSINDKSYSYNNNDTSTIFNNIAISYTKPILKSGGFVSGRYEIDKAARSVEISAMQYFLKRQDIISSVCEAYYKVIASKYMIKVNEGALERANSSLDRATRLLNEKMITKLDKTRAEIQYAQSASNLLDSKKQWQNAKDNLAILIGLEIKDSIDVIYEITDEKKEYDESQLVNDAVAYHKDLKVLEKQKEQTKSDFAYNQNQIMPEFNLVSSYNMQPSATYMGEVAYYNLPTWTVGLEGKYLFRDFSTEENLKTAKRNMKLKDEEIERKTQDVIEGVKSNLRELKVSYEKININYKNLEASETSLKAAEKMWEEGLKDNKYVIDAQQDMVNAQESLIQARINALLFQINLEKSAGYDLVQFFKLVDTNETQ